MGLKIDTNNSILQKTNQYSISNNGANKPISVFSFDNIKAHKEDLAIAGSITVAALIGLSVLTRKKIPVSSTKPFSFSDAHKINQDLAQFIENDFMKQVKATQKPTTSFDANLPYLRIDGAGTCTFFNNEIVLSRAMLSSKYYKLVDKKSGQCLANANTGWQITGRKKDLRDIIKYKQIKNSEIVPLTREERIKILKSTVAHEAFHSIQFANMVMHPEIGLERILSEIMKYQKVSSTRKQKLREIAIKTWGDLANSGKKIDPESELGKRTKKQFEDWINLMKKDSDKTMTKEDYYNAATEIEAYQKELEFAIQNNLLI